MLPRSSLTSGLATVQESHSPSSSITSDHTSSHPTPAIHASPRPTPGDHSPSHSTPFDHTSSHSIAANQTSSQPSAASSTHPWSVANPRFLPSANGGQPSVATVSKHAAAAPVGMPLAGVGETAIPASDPIAGNILLTCFVGPQGPQQLPCNALQNPRLSVLLEH